MDGRIWKDDNERRHPWTGIQAGPQGMHKVPKETYARGQYVHRQVAKAFRLRSDLVEVHVLNGTAEIKKPHGAVRRIIVTYNAEGKLADFVDEWKPNKNFGKKRRDLRREVQHHHRDIRKAAGGSDVVPGDEEHRGRRGRWCER